MNDEGGKLKNIQIHNLLIKHYFTRQTELNYLQLECACTIHKRQQKSLDSLSEPIPYFCYYFNGCYLLQI